MHPLAYPNNQSIRTIPYLDDSFEARANVGATSALALLALTPPLQLLLRTKPLRFMGE